MVVSLVRSTVAVLLPGDGKVFALKQVNMRGMRKNEREEAMDEVGVLQMLIY